MPTPLRTVASVSHLAKAKANQRRPKMQAVTHLSESAKSV